MNLPVVDILFVAWAAAVAICDCRSRRISNSLVVVGLAAAFVCTLFQRSPFNISAGQAALGAVVGIIALLPFFWLGAMGAADVKVFAALGAWCGTHTLLGLWIAANLVAGVHVLWLLVTTRTRLAAIGRHAGPTFEVGGKASTPYAACLTMAACAWLALQMSSGVLR